MAHREYGNAARCALIAVTCSALLGCAAPQSASGLLAPDPRQLLESPTRERQSMLLREWMAAPAAVPKRVDAIEANIALALGSPSRLLEAVAALGAQPGERIASIASARNGLSGAENRNDRLAQALRQLAILQMPTAEPLLLPSAPATPNNATLPEPLRTEIAEMLHALAHAEVLRREAIAKLPAEATAAALILQLTEPESVTVTAADLRTVLPLVDRHALAAGMHIVAAATERLDLFLASHRDLPALYWQAETPLGRIVIDTTRTGARHELAAPLLLLDLGGDDDYLFLARPHQQRISVVVDHGGNDRYVAATAAADPSSAVMGYGVLIDSGSGDDRYQGPALSQGAAVLGAALLIDRGGNNQFVATAYAQAFALGGWAALEAGHGRDTYDAVTHAQGAAGPEGTALLLDRGGNDAYVLGNAPLLRPSPQLPDRNASMGQGAGRGWRPDAAGQALSATGGIGVLFDMAGSDTYMAQVFAQGVGYHEGVGLLIDRGGDNHFDAAWYAMGAAAHDAVGVLIKRGPGNDHYRVTHSMAMAAAHDFSSALFLDEAGNDSYALGNLGLGVAIDNSVALFTDGSGDDTYIVQRSPCRAFGTADITEPSPARITLTNAALFTDRRGDATRWRHCDGSACHGNFATESGHSEEFKQQICPER